jgi:SAM-dependent methyltransferase
MTRPPPSSTQQTPLIFSRSKVRRNRDRAAKAFENYAFLKQRVSRDIVERLDDTPRTFEAALDLGAHDGRLSELLRGADKVKKILTADFAPKMVEAARARGFNVAEIDEEALPFPAAEFDLVISALSLHWVNDLPGTLIQIRRALSPDGLFVAALLGAGTLQELRASLLEAETDLRGGAAPRVSPLPGLSDMAGLMQRAGFALPVVDRDTITVRYDTMRALMDDLKGMGESAAFAPGAGQPMGRAVLKRAGEVYAQNFADEDGRIRATFEVVYLSGWAPAPGQPKPLKPGSAKVSLASALGSVERSAGEKAGKMPD